MRMIKTIFKNYSNSKFVKNLSWIFFGNIAHAVLQFLLNIICARAFGTNDYGLINYGASLIAFFTAIGTFGFRGVITKFFAENEDNAGELIGTGIYVRLGFSVISIILLQIIISFSAKTDSQIRLVVFCQSLQILFASSDLFQYWFRYKSEAKIVAILRLAAFFICAVWKIIAILVYHDIVLYVIGVSLETGFFTTFQLIQFKKEYGKYRLKFSMEIFKKMIRISYPFIFSAILVTIYGQTDKIMLKSMLDNTAVGLYSVSLTIAAIISIIPTALIEGYRPDIMSFKITNQAKYRRRLQQLYGLVFWICVAYCLFISVFTKPIVSILYGEQYMGAVSSLSIVVWYTSFSYFGAINNVFMVAENKTKWVQISALAGASLNVVFNFMLIPSLGIVGAAIASLATQILANFVMLLVVPALRDAFIIVIEGIALKGFAGTAMIEKK